MVLDMLIEYVKNVSTNILGYALINRLLFIADTCPPLQKDSLIMLINYTVEVAIN